MFSMVPADEDAAVAGSECTKAEDWESPKTNQDLNIWQLNKWEAAAPSPSKAFNSLSSSLSLSSISLIFVTPKIRNNTSSKIKSRLPLLSILFSLTPSLPPLIHCAILRWGALPPSLFLLLPPTSIFGMNGYEKVDSKSLSFLVHDGWHLPQPSSKKISFLLLFSDET